MPKTGPKCPLCGAPGEQLLTTFQCTDETCKNWHDPFDPKRKVVHDRVEARAAIEMNARPLDSRENRALWEQGITFHLLDALQQRIYERWYEMPPAQKRFVALISRRAGKTFTFSCIAIEHAMRKPGSLQHYGAMTTLQVERMLIPAFSTILDTCPDHLKPRIYVRAKKIVWPNGSELLLGGCEDHQKCDRFRGAYSDNWWIDEAGYIGPLNYLVQSVALPMLHAREGARITMYSNAPYSPAHDIVRFVEMARESDCYFHATVYDSPRYSEQDIEEFAEAAGGKDSAEWKREYGCEIVVDEEHAIIPEWTVRSDDLWVPIEDSFRARKAEPDDYNEDGSTKSHVMEPLVREVERPQYFDVYTFIDLGFDPDLTSVLAAYWDFENARLVIEDERELSRMTTDQLAEAIYDIEKSTWEGYWAWQTRIHGAEAKPFQRVIDQDKQMHADLSIMHSLDLTQGSNHDLNSQVNRCRQLVKAGKLVVHPRCVNLIAHLKAGCWDSNRKKFARPHKKPRPNERYYGHFDHLQALVLGHAHVQKAHNPFPVVPHGIHYTTHHISERAVAQRKAENDGDDGLVKWGERLTERRRKVR